MLTKRSVLRSCLVALSLATPLAFVAAARADVACGDQTCPKNYACEAQPVACPAIACAPDQPNCTPPDCSGTVDTCVALPCTTDSDCAEGMVCYGQTNSDCVQPTCPPGDACPSSCPSDSSKACVPKYLLACQTAADCGDGFTCDPAEQCSCSVSASSGSASGSGSSGSAETPPAAPTPAADAGAEPAPAADGGVPPPDAPNCDCKPASYNLCNLKSVPCNADADCPFDFKCTTNPKNGACSTDSSGNTDCGTSDPPMICAPPSYVQLIAGGTKGTTGTPTSSSGSNDDHAPVPPTAENANAAGTSASSSSSADGGGCSIVSAPGGAGMPLGLAAFAVVGLLAARRRRTP